jgi:ligand-binding SRPBCC domain-containing protein
MPKITLETRINAPIEVVYKLSLSVDLHQISTQKSGEHIVAGVKTGIMELGDSVTWRAKHFGIWQNLTSKIIASNPPFYFCDEMQKGAFKSFRHEHHFKTIQNETLMQDIFEFESPFGVLGRIFNQMILTKYMTRLLRERNEIIKEWAESGKYKTLIKNEN